MQCRLGHSTPMLTLNVYAHLFEDDLDGFTSASTPRIQNARRPPDGLGRTPGPQHDEGGAWTGLNRPLTCPKGFEPSTLG